jgi:hypothetical protein
MGMEEDAKTNANQITTSRHVRGAESCGPSFGIDNASAELLFKKGWLRSFVFRLKEVAQAYAHQSEPLF